MIKRKTYLSGAHGGFEGGETVVEGAENGDDAVADGLALLDRLPHHRRSLTERIHAYCYAHFSLSLSLSEDREAREGGGGRYIIYARLPPQL